MMLFKALGKAAASVACAWGQRSPALQTSCAPATHSAALLRACARSGLRQQGTAGWLTVLQTCSHHTQAVSAESSKPAIEKQRLSIGGIIIQAHS